MHTAPARGAHGVATRSLAAASVAFALGAAPLPSRAVQEAQEAQGPRAS